MSRLSKAMSRLSKAMSRKTTKKEFRHWRVKENENFTNFFNPLLSIAHKSARIDKITILKLEGIFKKNSYERRDYE